MSNQKTSPNPDDAIRGKILQLLRINDESTKGNYHIIEDYEVPHGTESRPIEFGLLQSKVYNERNTNKSRRSDLIVDTYDLFALPSVEHSGLESIGGDDTYTIIQLQDSSQLAIQDLLRDHKIIKSQFVGKDRVHGEYTTTKVDQWNPRTTTGKDPDFGDLLKIVTKQVVPEAEVDPVGTEIVDIQKEQIGFDKFLRTTVSAPDGLDPSISRSLVAVENSEVITEKLILPKGAVIPAPELKTIESKVEPYTGYKDIWTHSYLKDSWPILTSYEEEPVTGLKVTLEREIVDTATPTDVSTPGKSVTFEQVGRNKYVKTTRTIFNGVNGIESLTQYEYHHVEYDFPQYLDNPQWLIHPLGGVNTASLHNPKLSSTHRLKVPCRFEITYHTAFPALSPVFQFRTVDWIANGFLWYLNGNLLDPINLNFQNIITDEHTIYLYVNYTGTVGLTTFTCPKSSPTTSEYKTYMSGGNKEALIIEEITEWKYNIFRRVKVWMKFPDLRQGSFTGTAPGVQTIPNIP